MALELIVFLPLVAALIAGLGGRWIGKTAAKVSEENRPAEQCADDQCAGGDHLRRGLADDPRAKTGDDRGDERQEDDVDDRMLINCPSPPRKRGPR